MEQIRDEKGLAMPLVLMLMVVMALLGTAIWFLSVTEIRQVEQDQKRTQSHYLAAAGADAVGQYITINPDEIDLELFINALDGEGFSNTITVSSGLFGEVGDLELELNRVELTEGDETIKLIQLTGKGNVDNVMQHVNLYLEKLSPAMLFDSALKVNNNVDLTRMSVLSGDIISSGDVVINSSLLCGDDENSKQYCNPEYQNFGEEGPFDIHERTQYDYKSKKFDTISNEGDFEDSFEIGNGVLVPLSTNRIIDEIDVNNGGTLVIDATEYASSDLKIEVNVIDMKQNASIIFKTHADHEINLYINEEFEANGTFEVEGFGGVNIYIRNNASFKTPSSVVENAYLIVYLEEGSEMSLHANAVFRGYIYGPEATVKTHSDKSTVIGSVIANSFVAHNQDDAMGRLIYEPFVREKEIELNLGYRLSYWTR